MEAEYRAPVKGEMFIGGGGKVLEAGASDHYLLLILTPIKKWRKANMPEDWGKECRVRDMGKDKWNNGYVLVGITPDGTEFPFLTVPTTNLDSGASHWGCCEVQE